MHIFNDKIDLTLSMMSNSYSNTIHTPVLYKKTTKTSPKIGLQVKIQILILHIHSNLLKIGAHLQYVCSQCVKFDK